MQPKTHRIVANGLTHAVDDYGPADGPAALLLHGFPDSRALWAKVAPRLAAQGYRVLAPDLRGFGDTDMAARTKDYEFRNGPIGDALGILGALGIGRADLVGHDFGAALGWMLTAAEPARFRTFAALSVGHPRAFLSAGWDQKRRSLYIVLHQLRGVCEAAYRLGDWRALRRHWSRHGDIEDAIAKLQRPGRLTAGLNWYRANAGFDRMISPPPPGALGPEIVKVPTLGVWSDADPYLGEAQMAGSARYVKAPWRFERYEGVDHWIPYGAPERLALSLLSHWRSYSEA